MTAVEPVAGSTIPSTLTISPKIDSLVISAIDSLTHSLTHETFWTSFAHFCGEFMGENESLIKERYRIQREIDSHFKGGGSADGDDYRNLLVKIGYLSNSGGISESFKVTTANVGEYK